MKTVSSVACVSALFLSLIGCNPFAPDQSVILPVTNLDAPASVGSASPLVVTLTLQTGGCTRFDRIDIQKMTAGARIVPWGTDGSIGRDIACTGDIRSETHTVQIDPPFVNPYHLTVEQGRLAPVTAMVDVQ